MDANTFLTNFPEFAPLRQNNIGTVNYWVVIASKIVTIDKWGDLVDHGQCLYIAHNLAMNAANAAAGAKGKTPGQTSGVLSQKSVDRVSASYDTTAGNIEDGGHWNLTTYGKQYLQLARMIGAGAIQL